MAVPLAVREVERPRNTVVVDTGSNGTNRYAVRERLQSVCRPNQNPSPRNGRTIGHIINLTFVPVVEQPKLFSNGLESLSYGSCALTYSVSKDIQDDLLHIFSPADAMRIMAIAMVN